MRAHDQRVLCVRHPRGVCPRDVLLLVHVECVGRCVPVSLIHLFDASDAASCGSAEAKRSFHDIRRPCETNPDCYEEDNWVEEYMNRPDVRTALGVDPRAPEFVECNKDMIVEFMAQGDGMRDTKSVLPELVDEGIRLLVYTGNTGARPAPELSPPFIDRNRSQIWCATTWLVGQPFIWTAPLNVLLFTQGNSRWVAELPSTYKDAFAEAQFRPWIVSGQQAGVVRSAGEGAGNVTYLTVYEAGYAVLDCWPILN